METEKEKKTKTKNKQTNKNTRTKFSGIDSIEEIVQVIGEDLNFLLLLLDWRKEELANVFELIETTSTFTAKKINN